MENYERYSGDSGAKFDGYKRLELNRGEKEILYGFMFLCEIDRLVFQKIVNVSTKNNVKQN